LRVKCSEKGLHTYLGDLAVLGILLKSFKTFLIRETAELPDENIGAYENNKDRVDVLESHPVPKGRQLAAQGESLCKFTHNI